MSGAVEGVALLPCPYCGGGGQTLKDADPRYPWYVKYEHASECPLFFVAIGNPQSYRSKSAAITAWNTRTTPPARSYADGVELACVLLEEAIGEGYPTPLNKLDQCDHGKFGWEDCIACYDDALFAKIAAIRLLSQGGKA